MSQINLLTRKFTEQKLITTKLAFPCWVHQRSSLWNYGIKSYMQVNTALAPAHQGVRAPSSFHTLCLSSLGCMWLLSSAVTAQSYLHNWGYARKRFAKAIVSSFSLTPSCFVPKDRGACVNAGCICYVSCQQPSLNNVSCGKCQPYCHRLLADKSVGLERHECQKVSQEQGEVCKSYQDDDVFTEQTKKEYVWCRYQFLLVKEARVQSYSLVPVCTLKHRIHQWVLLPEGQYLWRCCRSPLLWEQHACIAVSITKTSSCCQVFLWDNSCHSLMSYFKRKRSRLWPSK